MMYLKTVEIHRSLRVKRREGYIKANSFNLFNQSFMSQWKKLVTKFNYFIYFLKVRKHNI